ncbi:MAG: hypothetical protein K0R29_2062 [Pseudobdellovibrio sp.]|jgi:hypothetical protein|nr:hypothetical protein [Pseudobdellovibrio sp.]
MKPTFSKALVCGILASTFFIINCQKAPSRGVKADSGNQNGKQTAAQLPVCSEAAKAAREARKPIFKEIKDVVDAQAVANVAALSDDKKIELHDKTNLLDEKTSDLIEKIRASAPAGAMVDGCKLVGTPAEGEVPVKIADLIKDDRDLAGKVAQITGQQNNILIRAAQALEKDREFVFKAAMTEMLSNENSVGEKALSEGQIINKEQYRALQSNKDKTFCILSAAPKAQIPADSKAKLINIGATQNDADMQRSVAELSFQITTGSDLNVFSFKCALAQNKNAMDEMRNAFGDLISAATASAPAPTPAPEQPAPAPAPAPAPEQPAPAPAPAPAPEQPAPAPAPATEPAPAPAPAPEQPAPAPAPQVTQQQVQEAEALNALVQRLNSGN